MTYCAEEQQQDETWMECLKGGAIRLGLGILIGGAASVALASETPVLLGTGIGGILAVTNCKSLYKENEECPKNDSEEDEEEMDLSCFGGVGKKAESEPCDDDAFDACDPCQDEDDLDDHCDDFDDDETYAVHKEGNVGEKYLCAPEKMLDTDKYVFFKCKPVSEIQDDVTCPFPCEDEDD